MAARLLTGLVQEGQKKWSPPTRNDLTSSRMRIAGAMPGKAA